MPGVSLKIITNRLSFYKEVRPIAQKKTKMDEEKSNATKTKLISY